MRPRHRVILAVGFTTCCVDCPSISQLLHRHPSSSGCFRAPPVALLILISLPPSPSRLLHAPPPAAGPAAGASPPSALAPAAARGLLPRRPRAASDWRLPTLAHRRRGPFPISLSLSQLALARAALLSHAHRSGRQTNLRGPPPPTLTTLRIVPHGGSSAGRSGPPATRCCCRACRAHAPPPLAGASVPCPPPRFLRSRPSPRWPLAASPTASTGIGVYTGTTAASEGASALACHNRSCSLCLLPSPGLAAAKSCWSRLRSQRGLVGAHASNLLIILEGSVDAVSFLSVPFP